MKNITKKQKILIAIIVLIIAIGTVIAVTVGFNFDLRFQNAKKVELYLEKEFEISDIKAITNETIPNEPVVIQKIEVYEDSVSILVKDITEEQKENLINKINEKYGTDISAEETEIETVQNTRGRDFLKPYILPFTLATIIVLIYMAARYRKLGITKTILKTIIISVIAQATLFGLIAITRIPIGRLTIPMIIAVYLLTLVGITTKFEKELKNKNLKEKK